MLSSLLRPKRKGRHVLKDFPFPSAHAEQSTSTRRRREQEETRHAAADWTETDNDDEDTEENYGEHHGQGGEEEGEIDVNDEDSDEETPLLPIFSAAHLDSLPVYHLTHTIRMIILPRCETTLTWEQLRSPQVSQFLVKPMQQQIRSAHFSRATLYALMANCLQFWKEAQMNPGNGGVSRTRAMVCELLAIKLLKEYTTRELIDALSYDFYPLQGQSPAAPANSNRQSWDHNRPKIAARISTLEVAIRAQAKRFVAHPLVTIQLEAIWAGTIVFHSSADQLHRPQTILKAHQYRSYGGATQNLSTSPDKVGSPRQGVHPPIQPSNRRTVTLYDPRDASLFKLSRLRVPRYRQFFSTLSLAVLLCLYLAVLTQRSMTITWLEIVFWLWSAGFMLDEIVGFNEQGFALYILSVWNAFDLGILLLLLIFYCMRLYGLFLIDRQAREDWNNVSYDILAANAVLLFPRLFNVLDHSRYFSQLLIAFRLMAIDLVAVLILIIISCSGFFVAFSLSFGDGNNASDIAYGLFQLVLGFTPAAWSLWPEYNILGKGLLTLFLFICHFLIITILICVLSNSFMAIVSNANEEHQFVFAVNTISMVKNDALFSYVAPSNILAWFLSPLRYIMPFRSFVKLNRYVIKFTHWPLLFTLFLYEKMFLARSVYEPTDLIENQGRERKRAISFMDPNRVTLFSPTIRMKQESVAGFQTDRALEEVFRRVPRQDLRSNVKSQERRETSNVVNHWMAQNEGIASSPPEQDYSVVDRLERKMQASQRATLLRRDRLRRQLSGTRSVGSGPLDWVSPGLVARKDIISPRSDHELPRAARGEGAAGTEDDGDDELVTNEDESNRMEKGSRDGRKTMQEIDYFRFPQAARMSPANQESPSKLSPPKPRTPRRSHNRNLSSTTILYNPVPLQRTKDSSSASPPKLKAQKPSAKATPKQTPSGSGALTPNRRSVYGISRPRPININRPPYQPSSLHNALFNLDSRLDPPTRSEARQRRSSLDMGVDITSDLGLPDHNLMGGVPASFATQMAMAQGLMKTTGDSNEGTEGMMGRLMLARMKNLEEGLQEVVREFKGMRTQGNSPVDTADERRRDKEKGKKVVGKKRERGRERQRPRSAAGKENMRTEGAEQADDQLAEGLAKKGSSY